MKNYITTVAILFISFHCFSQISADSIVQAKKTKKKLTIDGSLHYTSISRGGVPRDERNVALIPLQKFKLYAVQLTSMDSIPKVVKSFTTDKNGQFSVSLPPGIYGFVTNEDIKRGLSKGQCLPENTQTNVNNIINSSDWECNVTQPFKLVENSIMNLEIINHLTSFCINCQ